MCLFLEPSVKDKRDVACTIVIKDVTIAENWVKGKWDFSA